MRAVEFLIERKKKSKKRKSKNLRGYFFPGYAYYGIGSGETDSGGGDGGGESVYESPEIELAKKLPSLSKHDYSTIDKLVKTVASKHKITSKILNDKFAKKYKKIPSEWIKGKLDEARVECDLQDEVNKFADWASKKLNIKTKPEITLSMDTEEAQTNHHTGSHTEGDNKVWVYAKNRNLVDILRTVVHELTHVRQSELNMIQPGDSYPGSPIEMLADMVAGKLIKIYGEKNHYIFQ